MIAILAIEGKIIWLATCSSTKENYSSVPLRTATVSLLSKETWNGMWRNFMTRILMTVRCKSSTYARSAERHLSLHQSWGSMRNHMVSVLAVKLFPLFDALLGWSFICTTMGHFSETKVLTPHGKCIGSQVVFSIWCSTRVKFFLYYYRAF